MTSDECPLRLRRLPVGQLVGRAWEGTMEGQQQRMFRLAVDAIDVSAFYEHRIGWHLCIRVRRADESWGDVQPELYDRLSTDELADVIEATIRNDLGLGKRS